MINEKELKKIKNEDKWVEKLSKARMDYIKDPSIHNKKEFIKIQEHFANQGKYMIELVYKELLDKNQDYKLIKWCKNIIGQKALMSCAKTFDPTGTDLGAATILENKRKKLFKKHNQLLNEQEKNIQKVANKSLGGIFASFWVGKPYLFKAKYYLVNFLSNELYEKLTKSNLGGQNYE